MIKCEYWPDARPKNDWSGKKYNKLTYIQPLYRIKLNVWGNVDWYYLCECECGNEFITKAARKTKSCGCSDERINASKKPKEAKKKSPFVERVKYCIKNNELCVWYRDCQDEQIETKTLTSRFEEGGSCYTEKQYLGNLTEE